MGAFTTIAERIVRQPALTMPGNATGSEAACTALTGSQIRALCGLGTTDNVTFNTVTATTSVLTPLVTLSSAFSGSLIGNSPSIGLEGVSVRNAANSAYGSLYAAEVGLLHGATTNSSAGCLDSGLSAYRIMLNRGDTGIISTISTGGMNWYPLATNLFPQTTPDLGVFRTSAGVGELTSGTRVSSGGTLGTLNVATVDRPTAALTLGNSTYGVTVPGLLTTFGNAGVNLSYVASQYAAVGFNSYHNGSNWIAGQTGYGHVLLHDKTAGNLEWYLMGSYSAGATQSPSRIGYVDNAGIFRWNRNIRAYGSGNSNYIGFSNDNIDGSIGTNSGNINILPTGGTVAVTGAVTTTATVTANSFSVSNLTTPYTSVNHWNTTYLDRVVFGFGLVREADIQTHRNSGGIYGTDHRVYGTSSTYDSGGTKYIRNAHDGTNGILSTSSGNLNLVPAGGTVAVTGGITASGAIQETYRTSSLDPTVSDIGSGKRQGWYNTSSLEFRDWVNVGGTLYKSAAYT